ncbi:hypothetical protein ABG768_021765, partial [Culter alburnus]
MTSSKFRAAPLALSEDEEKAAKDALCPPSHHATAEEDIFSQGDYLTLQGPVQKELFYCCGNKVLDVSLWREEALCELY